MTVPTTNITSGPYTGNGLSDEYDYDFKITSEDQLLVYETDDVGTRTVLELTTDYTVTGVGNTGGGTVVRVAGNLPTGYTWYIRSNFVAKQETSFSSQGGFFPAVHEAAFDLLTKLSQQNLELLERCFRLDAGFSGNFDNTLPNPVAGAYVRWNNTGDALVNDTDISTVITISGAIAALAAIADELVALAAIIDKLVALSPLTGEIAALGALSSEIAALGAITADISTAAANTGDISTVADNIATILQAVDAVGYAMEWAIKPEDVPVSIEAGGDGSTTFSALHWAAKAAASAGPVNIVDDLTPQLGGDLDGQDKTVYKVNLKDYGEITNAIGSIGGGTQDIDLTLGNVVTATVDTSATTFTFSNPTASDEGCGFTLYITNGGSQTVTWPASVKWPSATAPTLTAAGVDKIVFETVDGGVTWLGNLVGLAYA